MKIAHCDFKVYGCSCLGEFRSCAAFHGSRLCSIFLTCDVLLRDTNMTLFHSQPQTLQARVNEELNKINCWMNINKLSINYDKTKYIVVTKRKVKPKLRIPIGDNLIEQNNCIKYVGVKIEEDLSWKPQIRQQCIKIVRGSWAIQHSKKYEDRHTLHLMYYNSSPSPTVLHK